MAEEVGEQRAHSAWDSKKIDYGTQASGNGRIKDIHHFRVDLEDLCSVHFFRK